jgi:hypothetical protein
MKLDKDIVREILLKIESEAKDPNGWMTLEIADHPRKELSYHVQLLAEAGFIEAQDLCRLGPDGYEWQPKRLTYAGHELLDTIRDPEIWRLTKEGAKKVGSNSLTALFEIGKFFVKQKLTEHGVHLG